MSTILPTENQDWGFWGTMREHAAEAWPIAFTAIHNATSLQLKLIQVGARVVRPARAITFQLAEIAVTSPMLRAIRAAIRRLRAPPSCA